MKIPLVLIAAFALLLAGCERDLDGPRQYFAKGKIGSAPDFGIVKFKDPENMVAVVYGFADADAQMCEVFAQKLNEEACKETGGDGCLNPFSCVPLNTYD